MKTNTPNHVAIIPNGNRRWAKEFENTIKEFSKRQRRFGK